MSRIESRPIKGERYMCTSADNRPITAGEFVSHRAVSGGFWVFSTRFTAQAFSLARLVILARFLDSYDFGLMGIALLTMTSIDTFSQTGFQHALIQKKGDIKDYLDAAWTFLVLRGVAITLIIFAVAPFAADLFGAPEAMLIIGVTGLSMLLISFTNIGVIYFQKDLDFKKYFIYMVGGTITDFAVAIGAVLVIGSVWALVFGLLAGHLVRMLTSYTIHQYRPKWNLDFRKARELFDFGKWILGSTILLFLVTRVDSIVVGVLVSVAALGFYQMAYNLANAPTAVVANVVSQVTFPAYAKLQENMRMLRSAYLRVLKATSYFSVCVACFIVVLAENFTVLFMGENWLPMVPIMQILVIAGTIRSVAATTWPVFNAIGKPRIDTSWQALRLCVLAISIPPLIYFWEANGAALAVLISISVASVGLGASVIRVTDCGKSALIKTAGLPLILATPTVLAMLSVKTVLQLPQATELVLVLGIGISVWWIMTIILDHYWSLGIKKLLSSIISSLRKER